MTGDAEPLRILLLNWQDRENPQAGGAEIHLHEIFGRLAERGHEIRAVVSGWSGAAPHARLDGLGVERVGGRYSFAVRAAWAARRTVRDFQPDVVVEDINKVPLYAPVWAGTPVVALVPHLFGTTAFREAGPGVASVVWLAERAIPRIYRTCPFQVISKGTASDLVGRGIAGDRIAVIHPGIDHDRFRPGDPADRDERPTILYLGRLKRYKGIDVLLIALRRLVDGGLDARLVIAGRGDDRARLARIAERQGVMDRVRFIGYIAETEKVSWLRRATVLAYPSPKEGWGISNVEASACGTPVVASDSPGLRESVRDGESGLLIEHGDASAWTSALRRVLCDAELRAALGRGGIAHAARFSWDGAAADTEAHLVETVAREERIERT
ncbi:MAG: glycosyltransferase family 4 protein [Gemmatimonadetes bacterium]|nr:glycosyltransferase family 4 protein [Gemmatimonadota bacterium]